MSALPRHLILISMIVLIASVLSCAQQETTTRPDFVLVVHGGAGTILKENMTPELERAYTEKLTEAMKRGYEILDNDGTALSAVEATIPTTTMPRNLATVVRRPRECFAIRNIPTVKTSGQTR